MTDITVSRELLRQAIDALNEADNVLTSSMFAESADSLRAALDAEPAPEAKPEKLNPLTQLQVAYVMGLRDANSAPQPAPAQEPTRFDIDMDGSMEPSEFGAWVRYEDI